MHAPEALISLWTTSVRVSDPSKRKHPWNELLLQAAATVGSMYPGSGAIGRVFGSSAVLGQVSCAQAAPLPIAITAIDVGMAIPSILAMRVHAVDICCLL